MLSNIRKYGKLFLHKIFYRNRWSGYLEFNKINKGIVLIISSSKYGISIIKVVSVVESAIKATVTWTFEYIAR